MQQNETEARVHLDRLKRREHRSAVALLLYDPEDPPDWMTFALVHSLRQCDYVALILTLINQDSQFLNLDADSERVRLSNLAEQSGAHPCVLVTEFDVALARLTHDERMRLWNNLLLHFPYRNSSLLLAVPQRASHLLPDPDSLLVWSDSGKVILLNEL